MLAGGRESFVKQVMIINSPYPTAGWDEERVNTDTGTTMKKMNKPMCLLI